MNSYSHIPPLRSLDVPAESSPKRVTVLRGLPASGKSTAATGVLALYPETVMRINNDDLSYLLFGSSYLSHIENAAALLANLRRSILLEGLKNDTVRLIIIDNTNLNVRTVAEIEALAVAFGAEFIVEDHFLSVSAEECMRRDRLRDNPVGPTVIERMQRQAEKLTAWESFRPVKTQSSGAQAKDPCFIIDLDPILRWLRDGAINDWISIYRNKLPSPAIELVKSIKNSGVEVIGVTSLSEKHYPEASVWANVHVFPGIKLYMKEYDSNGRSAMSKFFAYENHVKANYNVMGVIGEKKELVHIWKNIAQLPTFEVSFGDF